MQTISLPRKFWTDRRDRGLDMPKAIAWDKAVVVVSRDDPAMTDYLDDAEYYSDIVSMSGDRSYLGLQASARATVAAIRKARAIS